MGKHDSRHSMKMRRRQAQAKKKTAERTTRTEHLERAAKATKGTARRTARKEKPAG